MSQMKDVYLKKKKEVLVLRVLLRKSCNGEVGGSA